MSDSDDEFVTFTSTIQSRGVLYECTVTAPFNRPDVMELGEAAQAGALRAATISPQLPF